MILVLSVVHVTGLVKSGNSRYILLNVSAWRSLEVYEKGCCIPPMNRQIILKKYFPLFAVIVTTACGSGSNDTVEIDTSPQVLAIAEANPQELAIAETNASLSEVIPISISYEQTDLKDPGNNINIKLLVDKSTISESGTNRISIELSGATWAADEQPESCDIVIPAETVTENPIDNLICEFSSTKPDERAISLSLPISFASYQKVELKTVIRFFDETLIPSDTVLEKEFVYVPPGATELDSESNLSREIQKILSLGSGALVNSIHENYLALGECQNGGHRETTYDPGGFPAHRTFEFVNCSSDGVLFSGTAQVGQGRSFLSTRLSNAVMSDSTPDQTEFSGSASFIVTDSHEITLNGLIEHISNIGEVTAFTNYRSECKNGELFQSIFYNQDNSGSLANGIDAEFEMADNFLGGSRLSVKIAALTADQGTIEIKNDMGSIVDVSITSGSFPTVHINKAKDGISEVWTIPRSDEFTFTCLPVKFNL